MVSFPIECPICRAGDTKICFAYGKIVHRLDAPRPIDHSLWFEDEGYQPCLDYDAECRHVSEPLGLFAFAWWPVRCRNGKRRWLTAVERHDDGTYTLGNRAH